MLGTLPSTSQGDQRYSIGEDRLRHEDGKGQKHKEIVEAHQGWDVSLRILESVAVLLYPYHEDHQSSYPDYSWCNPCESRANRLQSMTPR